MKIGFVIDTTLDSTDGVQQYVLTFGAWLSGQGHEVHYLTGQASRSDVANIHSLSRNINVRFNGNRISMPLPARIAGIRAVLSAEKFDVLHVQVPYSPFMAGRVITAAPPQTTVVGTFHIAPHSGVVSVGTKLLAGVSRKSLKRFDTMLSVSTAAQAFALKTYGIGSTVLPNVVVASSFSEAQPHALDKVPGDGPVILFLGRLVPRKGCMVLLQAIRQLLDRSPSQRVRVVVCGKGPLLSKLTEYAAVNGIADFVHFAGFVTEHDKARYLKAADFAVFPSNGGESFGIVLLEAMAAERPVVLGAANPGYASVLAPNPASLFPVNDPAALAGLLRKYLDDSAARQETLDWQRAVLPQYDVNVVGRKLLEVYADARGRHAG